jgi:predicted CXXCH cytochrome family protein
MLTTKHYKLLSLLIFSVIFAGWVIGSNSMNSALVSPGATTVMAQTAANDDFVGSETCRTCHEPQFDSVAKTTHGKLEGMSSWEGKAVGCESCHGPGREHVEGGGDVTKIKVFKDMDPKAVSETCLTCHTGREAHNNFRRGDHWRNNVGCTDCHTAHGPDYPSLRPGSITFIGDAAVQRPSMADKAMLKVGEPQLCIGCHTETKAQFSKPFRHKVLEGTMTCSDCHNPHGGFEQKQTRLAVGADQSCIRCHSDKQGPFVFEHAPLKLEGCAACHTPHGSNNPKMLKRSTVRQMCLECHTEILNVEFDGGIPTGPHNQVNIRTQNCTICHVEIHGSNANRVFFR